MPWNSAAARMSIRLATSAADGGDHRPGVHGHAVRRQFRADAPTDLGVHVGHHRRGLLDQGDGEAAGGEGLGHLQADVAATHDHHRAGRPHGQGVLQGEGVAHGVQQVHAGQLQARDGRACRHRAGGHHQPVVGQEPLAAARVGDRDPVAGRVDGVGGVVQQQLDPGGFQVADGAVGERPLVLSSAHAEGWGCG
jgi:hypothetical protein